MIDPIHPIFRFRMTCHIPHKLDTDNKASKWEMIDRSAQGWVRAVPDPCRAVEEPAAGCQPSEKPTLNIVAEFKILQRHFRRLN